MRPARDPKGFYLPQYPSYGNPAYGAYPNYGYSPHHYGLPGTSYPINPPKKNVSPENSESSSSNSPLKGYPPKFSPEDDPIIYSNFEGPLPSFSYSYITGNGIQQSARYNMTLILYFIKF